jgi:hypothetical protein
MKRAGIEPGIRRERQYQAEGDRPRASLYRQCMSQIHCSPRIKTPPKSISLDFELQESIPQCRGGLPQPLNDDLLLYGLIYDDVSVSNGTIDN